MHKKIINSCSNVILSTYIESYFRRTIFYSINSYFKAKSSRQKNSRDFKCFDIFISAIIIIRFGDIEWHVEFRHVFPVQCHFLWGKRFGSNFSSPFRVRIINLLRKTFNNNVSCIYEFYLSIVKLHYVNSWIPTLSSNNGGWVLADFAAYWIYWIRACPGIYMWLLPQSLTSLLGENNGGYLGAGIEKHRKNLHKSYH